jgi:hypothetical protein
MLVRRRFRVNVLLKEACRVPFSLGKKTLGRIGSPFSNSESAGRVVRPRGGPVSLLMMHLPFKITATIAVVFALSVCTEARVRAQDAGSQQTPTQQPATQQPAAQQPSSQPGSSSSQSSSSSQAQRDDQQASQYGVYLAVDPLANVRYDNRFDMSLGFAYDHMKAGPTLLEGSNLGGLDVEGSYWLTRNWGIEATGRGYVGTSGTGPNTDGTNGGPIRGPFVEQYFFVGGAEWLGPHNKHGAMIAHAMFGGVYGNFQRDLLGHPPSDFDFYYNQIAPAAIVGGHFDLNRSENWVFRITPDAVMTHYTFDDKPHSTLTYAQYDVNFAISVGVEYKFTSIKRSTNKKINWTSGW